MRIDNDLIRFCAKKTRELEEEYEEFSILPSEEADEGFPRSADDLHTIMVQRTGKPIVHKQLRIRFDDPKCKYRSVLFDRGERFDICYARGMTDRHIRYYKTKELIQIHLRSEPLRTGDVVELVHNLIQSESPGGLDLDLGHSTASDTMGEVAAMQFLFPLYRRIAYLEAPPPQNGIEELSRRYGIPPFAIQRCFNVVRSMRKFPEWGHL